MNVPVFFLSLRYARTTDSSAPEAEELLEVDAARFGPQEIRYLYENAAYSLTRTAAG